MIGKREHILRLSQVELEYLANADFLTQRQRERFSRIDEEFPNVEVTLDVDSAEELRDAFSEQLARVGFDESYELTAEGKMLENLIDRFHIRSRDGKMD